jgi:hypothetical protein
MAYFAKLLVDIDVRFLEYSAPCSKWANPALFIELETSKVLSWITPISLVAATALRTQTKTKNTWRSISFKSAR